jgi:SAM-dependent methyltransferase
VPRSTYTKAWYEASSGPARQSAEAIVPIVMELLSPVSVCDVGCGLGAWLRVFEEQGVQDVLGIDSEGMPHDRLEIPADRFLARDLSKGLELDRTFDLAVSLEVAEHLPPEAGPAFVQALARLAPAVLFSAAIPNQGGRNHLNEQWPDYWEREFSASGYVAVDCIRSRIWQDDRIPFWYRQNTVLFVTGSILESRSSLRAEQERTRSWPRSVVHPRMLGLAVARPRMRFRQLLEQRQNGTLSEASFRAKLDDLLEDVFGPDARSEHGGGRPD